ncbi:MAG: SDR family oxidoreductase [Fimbriimonadaceae bacterium]
MILVVGATGLLGGEICRVLAAAGKPFRAMTRPTSATARRDSLRGLGAEIVTGDLKDRASLEAACKGVDAVISTASSTLSRQEGDTIESVDQAGQLSLIDAARTAGVTRFVYVSYSGNISLDCPLTTAKRAVEKKLAQSGLTYTILRPSYFMEVWLGPHLGFDFANSRATIYGLGDNKISYISVPDLARIAVECVDSPAARNAAIELGGPEPISPLEAVQIFEDSSWRSFSIEHVPEAELQTQYATAKDSLEKSFAALMLNYSHGDVIDVKTTTQALPGHLTSVREYAERVVVRSA